MDEKKQRKIMKEIEALTPYTAELQEFKEKGLFITPSDAGAKCEPIIYNRDGRRCDSKAKRKTNAQERKELREKAVKLRILTINKWLDGQFGILFPTWAIRLIRRFPQLRPFVLKALFTKVEIVHKNNPRPFGSDLITITCFWSKYAEVNFVWEK